MIEDAVYTHLAADSGVAALVVKRIYPGLAPESPTYPLIVFRFISEISHPAMGGDVGIVERRLQVDCWDETATGAQQLGDAVTTALSRFMGTVTYTGGSTVIEDIYRDGVMDLFDEHARKHQRAVDFKVIYQG
jgi:hypothetical protein